MITSIRVFVGWEKRWREVVSEAACVKLLKFTMHCTQSYKSRSSAVYYMNNCPDSDIILT